jgi:flagellin-like hook-associated protein FlgL
MSILIPKLSPILTNAINSVQENITKTQTKLATGLDPEISGTKASVILSLSSDITTWKTRSTNLKLVDDIVSVAQTGLTSISTLLYQMKNIATLAETTTGTSDLASLSATYLSLATQIQSTANSASVNGSNLLNTSSGITIYPALSSYTTSTIYGYNFATVGTTLAGSYTFSTAADAAAKVTTLSGYITTLSTVQTSLSAYSDLLSATATAATSTADGLTSYISDLHGIDTTALQNSLQTYNNQQSIDYYLVGQMNAAASEELRIFR